MDEPGDRATDRSGQGIARSEGHLLVAVADDRTSAIVARFERQRRTGRESGGRSVLHLVYQRAGRFPLVVVADEIDTAHDRWEYRTSGLWVEMICERPGIHWSYGLEAFALAIDRPDEMLGRGYGHRTPLGWELDFESDADTLSTSPAVSGLGRRWEQQGRVTGLLQLLPEAEPTPPRGGSGEALQGVDRSGLPAWLSAGLLGPGPSASETHSDTQGIDRPFSGTALRRHWWSDDSEAADPLGVLGGWPSNLPTVDEPESRLALPLRPSVSGGPVWWLGHNHEHWDCELTVGD